MKNVANKLDQLIGNTPLLQLENYKKKHGLVADLYAKLEYFNPAGSIKDRAAKSMLDDAEQKGLIKPGSTIVEPTSGNTGIGLASIGISRGYRVVLVMPETMSIERRNLLKAYGAELILTEGSKGINGSIEKAVEIAQEIEGSFIPSQFSNPANPQAHYESTGPEIWRDMDGKVDLLVAGVGTGGTISGVGKYLKEQNPAVRIVAVEPFDSPVLSEGKAGPHKIQGIGTGFIPEALDRSVIDDVIKVKNEDAFATGREIGGCEGILVGISSGAALWAAASLAKQQAYAGKNIVVILPDTGERYLSGDMFQ